MACFRHALLVSILVSVLLLGFGTSGSAQTYPGDCSEDWSVTIGEVQRSVNMFLGAEPLGCFSDFNGDGKVSIGEVQRVINCFLGECPGAEMAGLDTDGDGAADLIDADGDGVLDGIIEAECTVADPFVFQLLSRFGGPDPSYTAVDLPQGMALDPGGAITYLPPCTDAGTTQAPTFHVNDMPAGMTARFRVTETNVPAIVGLDLDGDGTADIIDANEDGTLDSAAESGCIGSPPFEGQLLAENAGVPPNFEGSNLPPGMAVGTDGWINYTPPCEDEGQSFTPAFSVDGGEVMAVPFEVTPTLRIAVDFEGDGIPDIQDLDGDGFFDTELYLPCGGPDADAFQLLGLNAGGNPSYGATNLEGWMALNGGTRVDLLPACDGTEGITYYPEFFVETGGRIPSPSLVLPVSVYLGYFDFPAAAPWYVCPAEPVPAETTVVTAFDRAYHYFGAENHRTITQEVEFPEEGHWSQVGMILDLECPESGLCDHWDRLGSVQMVLNPEDPQEEWEYLEITRHITPYRIEMCEYIDVTPLAHLLKGRRTLQSWIDTWVGPGHDQGEGWRLTIRFVFYPGTDQGADEIINVWGRRNITVGILEPPGDIDSQIDPASVTIPPDATRVLARLITTGHSFNNTLNCAEFCEMRQDLYVNGNRYMVFPWRGDCRNNPVRPQLGTYTYNRNGWCPGAIVVGDLIDITGSVFPGTANIFDFDIRLADGSVYDNTNPDSWLPFEAISLQILVYR